MRDALTFPIAVRLVVVAAVITIGTIFVGVEFFRLIPSLIMAAIFFTFARFAHKRVSEDDLLTVVVAIFMMCVAYLMTALMLLPVIAEIVELMTGSAALAESLFKGFVAISSIITPIAIGQRLFNEGWAERQRDRARIVLAAVKVTAIQEEVDFDIMPYDRIPISAERRRRIARRMMACIAIVVAMSVGTGYMIGGFAGNPLARDVSAFGFIVGSSIWIIGITLSVWLAGHAGRMYRLAWIHDGLSALERSEVELLKRSDY